jgi:hypothetical protein
MNSKFLLLLFLICSTTFGQSWQWGKRGGAVEALTINYVNRQEETYSVITDNSKNIYGLSRVGFTGLDIDNISKTNFDGGTTPFDYALFSFACDGTYRWSKIIGGSGDEIIHPLQTDAQNNLYVAGKFGLCTEESTSYPSRIENDFINTSGVCRTLFLVKYNADGTLQWMKRPQPIGVNPSIDTSQTTSSGIQVDSLGNIYWLVFLPQGTYADGAFINNQTGSNLFILKYDSNGNFISAIPIDMDFTGSFGAKIIFKMNPNNGNFYFSARKLDGTDTAILSGNTITHGLFLACYNSQGTYLWHREDTSTEGGYLTIYDIEFDAQNNIYLGGQMIGYGLNSFLGFSIPEALIPHYVLKINPTATLVLWSSYSNGFSNNYGDIVLNGNELGYTSYCGSTFTWGNQTLNANTNGDGQEVLLARFNKDNGACIGLSRIPGNAGANDVGAAITADASGDYILGGSIGGTLTFNNNQQIFNSGSQSDFFVAKYASQACSPLAVNESEIAKIKLYPNPASDLLYITIQEPTKYIVYNMLGVRVMEGQLVDGNQGLEVKALASGYYVIQLGDGNRTNQRLKFIKQ